MAARLCAAWRVRGRRRDLRGQIEAKRMSRTESLISKPARSRCRQKRWQPNQRFEHLGVRLTGSSLDEAPTPTARHIGNPPVRRLAGPCSLGGRRRIVARVRRATAACMAAQGSVAEGHREIEGHGCEFRSRPDAGGTQSGQLGHGAENVPRPSSPSAAAYLTVSDRTIRNWIRRGELPSYELGAARRIDSADVDAFLAQRREEAV